MRQTIPAAVIAACADIGSARETHASLDNLLMHAGANGEPPPGNKVVKVQAWLRQVNGDAAVKPLDVLGRFIEAWMEEEPPEGGPFDDFPAAGETTDQQRLRKILGRCGLRYIKGGRIGTVASTLPSRSLEDHLRGRDIASVDEEFARALATIETNPREAVSAASNILESLCKVYIADRGLEMPAKQDLKPVWTTVRKDLGLDPSVVADQDLQTILTGLFAVVDGVGALRTHASSAHGAGRRAYRLEPRHARLAIHAAHTVTLFVLESWGKKHAST